MDTAEELYSTAEVECATLGNAFNFAGIRWCPHPDGRPGTLYIALKPFCERYSDDAGGPSGDGSSTSDDRAGVGTTGTKDPLSVVFGSSAHSSVVPLSVLGLTFSDADINALNERVAFESWNHPIRRFAWGNDDFFARTLEGLIHPSTIVVRQIEEPRLLD